jgi:gluconolactonase
MPKAEVLVEGLDHPEGVCWDPASGALFAGGEAGQVYRVDLASGTAAEIARAPGFVLGIAVDGRGRLVACCGDGLCAVSVDGTTSVLAGGMTLPNHPAFAPDGAVYFADSGRWQAADGRVHRLGPDGTLDVFSEALRDFPNGCAVSPDGAYLWMVESSSPSVNRFDLTTGALEEICRLPGTVPDGIALTDDGGFVVSCYRPDRVVHVDRDGAVTIVAEDPQGTLLAAPTNVVFVGPGRDRLITANLGRWHLTSIVEHGLRGVPLHHPERWAVDA